MRTIPGHLTDVDDVTAWIVARLLDGEAVTLDGTPYSSAFVQRGGSHRGRYAVNVAPENPNHTIYPDHFACPFNAARHAASGWRELRRRKCRR